MVVIIFPSSPPFSLLLSLFFARPVFLSFLSFCLRSCAGSNMDPRAAAIRALVAERAADARVTAATSRRPRPLAVDAATFLAQEEQAAARRRRSQSGRRARP